MDALKLAKVIGLDGECAEQLQEFIADPTAWIDSVGKQARVAMYLREVAEGMLEQAKDTAWKQMGTEVVLVDDDIEFRWRGPTTAQVVNQKAVRALYSRD